MKKAIELIDAAKDNVFNIDIDVSYRERNEAMRDECINLLNEAIAELKAPPRWETPEQWKKRTGEKYPDKAPVWCADNDNPADPWFLDYYENAVDNERYYIICAVEGLVPPDDWRPKESPAKERPE